MYNNYWEAVCTKQRDLVKLLEKSGWWLKTHGSNHDIYTDGKNKEQIPRHKEINENLAKTIIARWGLK
ncbi:MAG: type II toxin-antitoxin system HicA family toxin [Oscillospiraceae bacterium]|nr:type II toxin-antitoxin system HicA family toxin [Oscillospiraceae bacterium]